MDDQRRKASGQLGNSGYASNGQTEPDHARQRSLTEVLKDIVGNIQEIIRSEVKLAKSEIGDQVIKAWAAARLLLAGAVLGLYALGLVLLGVVYAVALAMPAWAAALCVGGTVAIISAAVIGVGRARLKTVHAAPRRTIQTIEENVEWIKRQTR